MQAEIRDGYWAVFDTEGLKTGPGELIDHRLTEKYAIDPAAAMLDKLSPESVGSGALVPVRASIEALAAGRVRMPYERFDVVLTKEALHRTADKAAAMSWLAELLAPGGRLLIVMSPPTLSYPLFDAALRR